MKKKNSLIELQKIMTKLRSPNGCPWDREQTHQSLKANLLEEVYECLEAIDGGEDDDLIEELGDILLQVYHSLPKEQFPPQSPFGGSLSLILC